MIARSARILVAATLLSGLAAGCTKKPAARTETAPPDSLPTVVLETTKGRMVLELYRNQAPKTVDNILRHLAVHFYDGLTFHRVVPNFVIQTGSTLPDYTQVRTSSAPTVPNEAANGLKNVRGTVALARFRDPASGGVQFFINLKANPELDFTARTVDGFGYCVFGRVKEGMEVADAIGHVRTGTVKGVEERPLEPVVVTRAYLLEKGTTPASAPAAPGTPAGAAPPPQP
jgi:peptidyl-prolyl cis-trans isomerase B (cyclophilin B)